MSLPHSGPSKLPRSFYDKGTELLRQAETISDPQVKTLALEAAAKYYEADVNHREPFAVTLLILVLVYAIVIAAGVATFRFLGFSVAVAVVVGSYCVLAFLVGAALRAAGYITEKSFWKITQAGFKTILFIRRDGK